MEYIDYRELHRDTINKLHQMVNSGKITVKTACSICADFVPDSEDEKIRKRIIALVNAHGQGVYKDEMLAWLEKQGKNNMSISEATEQELEDNLHKALEKETAESWNEFLDEQGKQNPAWSEEDEKEMGRVIYMMEQLDLTESWSDCYTFLNSLKDRVQPKQEWSEEDEKMIEAIEALCDDKIRFTEFHDVKEYAYTIKNWLKSLKERYTWKPSNYQLEALESATENCAYSEYQDCLRELIGQLKKLREE